MSDRTSGLLLIGAGCIPSAAGAAYSATSAGDHLPAACPFQMITGVPCPLCGGTRAFAYASSGDLKFLNFNAFWVFAAIAMVIAGVIMLFTRFSLSGFWYRRGALPWVVVGLAVAAGWGVALLNRTSIVVS